MRTIVAVAEQFRREEEGAALIEYSILIGIILVVSIATIVFAGDWVAAQWTQLQTQLSATKFQQGAGGGGT